MTVKNFFTSVCATALVLNGVAGMQGAQAAAQQDTRAIVEAALSETNDASEIAALKKAAKKRPSAKAAKKADVEAAFAAVNAKFDGILAINAGSISSAGVAKDVVIAGPDSDIGLKIDQLRFWGLSPEALANENTGDAGALLASRLEGKGVSIYGLDKFQENLSNTVAEGMVDALEGVTDDETITSEDFETIVEKYDFSMGSLIIDGLTVFAVDTPEKDATPDNAVATDDTDVAALFMDLIAMASAQSRAFALDRYVVTDTVATLSYQTGPAKSEMSFSAPFYGGRDYNRGDLGYLAMEDLDVSIKSSEPTERVDGSEGKPVELDMTIQYDLIAYENGRFAGLYEALAKGALPPMTQTDVVDYGVMRAKGERQTLLGAPLVTVDESEINFSESQWLIPSTMHWRTKGATYYIGPLLEQISTMAALEAPGETTGESADGNADASVDQIAQTLQVLKDAGVETISFDADTVANWDPATGALTTDALADIDGFGEFIFEMGGVLPVYDKIVEAAPAEITGDWSALGAAFAGDAALSDYKITLKDAGGIDKTFALLTGFAKLAPEDDPSTAAFRNSTPEEARIAISSMMRVVGPSLAGPIPPAAGYITSFADFVADGGALSVGIAPSSPITLIDAMGASAALEAGDPMAMINLLNLSVEHSPANPE